jgi:hypothetical protein
MVGAPERLVFEGPPILIKPLAQDAEARRPVATEGTVFDTVAHCPSLTSEELQQYEAAKAKETDRCMPEAEKCDRPTSPSAPPHSPRTRASR